MFLWNVDLAARQLVPDDGTSTLKASAPISFLSLAATRQARFILNHFNNPIRGIACITSN
jgi:hypothetical protein